MTKPKAQFSTFANSPKIDVPALKKMLDAFPKKGKSQSGEIVDLNTKLKSLKNELIQIVFVPTDKTAKDSAQKFLIRILENGKKAIDYAHIFVHNQNIVRVERVR